MKITYKDAAVKNYIKDNDMLDDLIDNCKDMEAEEGVKNFKVTYDDEVENWYIEM